MFVWKFRIESFSLFEYFDIAKFNIEALRFNLIIRNYFL